MEMVLVMRMGAGIVTGFFRVQIWSSEASRLR